MIKKRNKKKREPSLAYGTRCDICNTNKGDIYSYIKNGKMQTRCRKHLRRP